MEFRMLGPLEILAGDGAPRHIAQPRLRAILAVLLLRAGRPCSREMLAGVLWGDEPPADPAAALRKHISVIRAALGADAGRLVTVGNGYRIDLRPGELDAERFTQLHSLAGAPIAAGDALRAAALLAEALACWREPALPDLPSAAGIEAEGASLLAQRRAAELALADAMLMLGRHQQILPRLRRSVAGDPLCEHARAQLMLALYRAGGKCAALHEYGRAREIMRRELGTGPGRELQELQRRILADDPELALPSSPPSPPGLPVPGGRADGTSLARRLLEPEIARA